MKTDYRNHERYADPTPYHALKTIPDTPTVAVGGVYEYNTQGGTDTLVLVVARNANIATILMLNTNSPHCTTEVCSGYRTSIYQISYCFISRMGRFRFALSESDFKNTMESLADTLNIPRTVTQDAVDAPVKAEAVNHPAHYQQEDGRECIEEMRLLFGDLAVSDFCRLNAYKYRFRAAMKNGEEDLKKANWYMDKLEEIQNGHRGVM